MDETPRDSEPKTEKVRVRPAASPDRAMEGQNLDEAAARRLNALASSFAEKAQDLEDSSHIFLDAGTRDLLLASKGSEKQAAWRALSDFLKSTGYANEADVNIGGDKTDHRVYDKLPANPKDASVRSDANGFTIKWTSPDFPNNEGYTAVSIDPKTHRITYTSTEITSD